MLEVYNLQRERVAILENAHGISVTERINALGNMSFSLPFDDPKNGYCRPFWYVRLDRGEMYRILPSTLELSDAGVLAYDCEHVLATLLDNVLFGYHIIGNLGTYTNLVLDYILSKQLTRNWVLGECDFRRQYEYCWEQENLLSALFSVPKPMIEKYIWHTDTSRYPWTVSLKQLDVNRNPEHYIRTGSNVLKLTRQSDPKNICTRLYCLGAGEGVNQLTIAGVNNGVPYLQAPPEIIAKYGIIERVWVDRRYTDELSLKQAGQVMLNELMEPYVEYSVDYANIVSDKPIRVGDMVKVIDTATGTSYINFTVETRTNYDEQKIDISIANKPQDLAASVADLADRQRIEMTYSQGATQIYADSIADNGDSSNAVELNFYIAQTMKIVNSIECKIKLSQFRSYSKATSTAEQKTQSSSNGGGGTSNAGGGTNTSTNSGGGVTTTANGGIFQSTGTDGGTTSTSSAVTLLPSNTVSDDSGGIGSANHNHGLPVMQNNQAIPIVSWKNNGWEIVGTVNPKPSGAHTHAGHSHTPTVPPHSHNINVSNHTHNAPAHTHDVRVPDHTHTIKDHAHTITIPAHAHDITAGIYRFGGANSFTLMINGKAQFVINATDAEVDITQYLIRNGSIPRGTWHSIGVIPNGLARVEISYCVQGFIQSRGNNTL